MYSLNDAVTVDAREPDIFTKREASTNDTAKMAELGFKE